MMRLFALFLFILPACVNHTDKIYLVRELESGVSDGERISVFGFINIQFENNQMGYSGMDVEFFFRAGPWLEFHGKNIREWGLVEGTVDLNNKGHMGGFPFALKDVEIVRLYPEYNPDFSALYEAISLLLREHEHDQFRENELDTLRSITGKNVGSTPDDWSRWLMGNPENKWRNDYIDGRIALPGSRMRPR